MISKYKLVYPTQRVSWNGTCVRLFELAAQGKVEIYRQPFCSALGIEYPRETMFWEEWCRWLYTRLTERPPPACPLLNSEQRSMWWNEKLWSPIQKRKGSKMTGIEVEAGILKDGFVHEGHKKILTPERTWYVVARTESHTDGQHRVVMLLHYNELLSGTVMWGVLTHEHPYDKAALQKAKIADVNSLRGAMEIYNRRCESMASSSALSYQRALGRISAEALTPSNTEIGEA